MPSLAVAPAVSLAQVPDLNLMNPETITGPQPYSSVSTDTETVNNANGNLIVTIPLLHLPGIPLQSRHTPNVTTS
jgi:hypothetical protein